MTKTQSERGDNNSELSSDDGKDRSDRKESGNDSASSSNGRVSGSGSGSGSGRGYNGDCSSDDASSSESSSKRNVEPEVAASLQKMDINKLPDEYGGDAIQTEELRRKKATTSMDPWKGEEEELQSWDVRSARQVGFQINALTAIIEQNRRMAEEPIFVNSEFGTLPQWNGIRISHPMDPRIDLGTVGHIPGSNVPVASNDTTKMTINVEAHQHVPPPTVDNYLNLMEAVRPYFLSYGFPLPAPPNDGNQSNPCNNEVGMDSNVGTGSSEGFTAFFTTTEKSNSSDSSDRKSNVKSSESKPAKTSGILGTPSVLTEQKKIANAESRDGADESDGSSSSMIVLARVKRKHQRKQHAEGEGDSNGSSGQPESHGDSLNHEGNDHAQGEVMRRSNLQAPDEAHGNSSSSSSSVSHPPINIGQDLRQNFHQLHDGQEHVHIVSETNTTNNTSGSGSGGQSGTNSGSGSNPGSSGSGNENLGSSGSGNEGKGSSDDAVAKHDNCVGEGNAEPLPMDAENFETHSQRPLLPGDEFSQEDELSRENRLLDKKRKRMNMRREYEEQVQYDLDSEDSPQEIEIRPGKPVTLDTVLSFTKIARVVVQSTPPFLVVHANAAYTALTGIDAHSIVGKPIRSVMSVPDSKRVFSLSNFERTDGRNSVLSSMTNSAHTNRQQTQIAGTHQQDLAVQMQQNETLNGILNYEAAAAAGQARANSNEVHEEVNVERLIAASGYGQIHVLHVSAKPHNMVGRNVTVFRESSRCTEHHHEPRHSEQGSHSSSLASNDAVVHYLPCRIGVSPVVSVSQALDLLSSQVVTDHENLNKRRKHHHQHFHRRHARASLVTHYCIQLEKAVPGLREDAETNLNGSQASNPVSNHKPVELDERARALVGFIEHAEEHSSQSSDIREPVTTIG